MSAPDVALLSFVGWRAEVASFRWAWGAEHYADKRQLSAALRYGPLPGGMVIAYGDALCDPKCPVEPPP